MKDKVYTFRHHRGLWSQTESEEELKNRLIETELSRGYLPAQITVEKRMANAVSKGGVPFWNELSLEPSKEVLIVMCWCSYAGKKTARKIWEKNKFMEFPKEISNPYQS